MRIRHLSLAVALLLPFGIVAVFADEPPGQQITAASVAPVDKSTSGGSDLAWLVTQDERIRMERAAEEEATRVAAEAAATAEAEAVAAAEAAEEAQRLEAEAAEARATRRRSQVTTTIAPRYTATTVASSPVNNTPRAGGAMPPKYVSDCESGGNPQAVNANGHYGKWQFSQSTWESVGGTGRPDQASEAEQDYRASLLWNNGAGSGHWSCY